MTADTVLNYFLKAGASFRRSDAWRRQHELEPGKSRLNRSGRFGIGVLAAFLIGDEISVATRHVSAPADGVCFEASLESAEIELRRCSRPVGTTIRVRIRNEEVWKKLAPGDQYSDPTKSWDWFCLSRPKVQRVVIRSGKKSELPQRFTFSAAGGELEPPWRRIALPDYNDVQWRYSDSGAALICNGILVKELEGYYDRDKLAELTNWAGRGLSCPQLSVFDPDGRLPLTLQRTSLSENRFPFHDKLLQDVLRDLIAWVLVNAPVGHIFDKPAPYAAIYPGLRQDDYARQKWRMFASTRNGTVLAERSLLTRLNHKNLLIVPSVSKQLAWPGPDRVPDLVLPLAIQDGAQERKDWFRLSVGAFVGYLLFGPLQGLRTRGRRILVSKEFLRELRKPRIIASHTWRNIQEEWGTDKWTLLKVGQGESGFDFTQAAKSGSDFDCVAEWYLNQQTADQMSAVGQAWEEYAGGATIIPYDMEERRRVFKDAFERLAPYIEAWEVIAKKNIKPLKS